MARRSSVERTAQRRTRVRQVREGICEPSLTSFCDGYIIQMRAGILFGDSYTLNHLMEVSDYAQKECSAANALSAERSHSRRLPDRCSETTETRSTFRQGSRRD